MFVLALAVCLVTIGVGQIYRPAGFIVAGLCLAVGGWLVLSD